MVDKRRSGRGEKVGNDGTKYGVGRKGERRKRERIDGEKKLGGIKVNGKLEGETEWGKADGPRVETEAAGHD